MKLYYDKRLSDPTYYVQKGFRNGSKTTTKNIMKIGKHSELLLITDDPLAYAREKIREMNEKERTGKVEYTLTADFNEKVPHTLDSASASTQTNIGYFMIQNVMAGLNLKNYFKERTKDMKNTFDCYTISRFLTYARILNPSSKLDTWKNLGNYYEKPDFDYQH
ncbi:MAG: transposase, partial [Clostridiales bacterium]|nr:transposase [Clostridiales bacterium]